MTAASDVIGIELVFDARIAVRRQHLVGTAEERLLRLGVLGDRLDQQISGDELVGGRDARERLGRIGTALRGKLRQARPHRREPAVDGARVRVVERDAPARDGDDLGDPGAHLPCADDEYVLELHRRRAYKRVEPPSSSRSLS